MNIRQLKYFLTIAEEGQITAAANKLNISQPPLSYQLKSLEEELGVSLFRRGGRSMTLTDEGLLLQKHARNILKEYEGTLDEFSNLKKGERGALYIATICSAAMDFLPNSIQSFLELYPNVDTQIFEVDSAAVPELVINGTAELGICREPFDHTNYHFFYLNNMSTNDRSPKHPNDNFVAVSMPKWLSPDICAASSIALKELEGKPLIVHRFYENMTRDYCSQSGFTPQFICTNENVVVSLLWALQGLGIALMPQSSATLISKFKGYEKLVVKPITQPSFSSNTVLIWAKDTYLSPTTRNFINYLKENLKRNEAL